MIGLDANVIVRYLAQDDPVQSMRAAEFLERRLSEDNPGFISTVAMAEIAWVLKRAYGFSDLDLASAIERLLQIDTLVVDSEKEVWEAAIALRDGQASFADALICFLGKEAGCSHTVTFDRKALQLPGFAPV